MSNEEFYKKSQRVAMINKILVTIAGLMTVAIFTGAHNTVMQPMTNKSAIKENRIYIERVRMLDSLENLQLKFQALQIESSIEEMKGDVREMRGDVKKLLQRK